MTRNIKSNGFVRNKKPFVKRDVEGYEKIDSPNPGDIVTHSGWHPGPGILSDYPADVIIINGAYMVEGRLSNFWNWRKINISKKGEITLGPIVSGYGAFRPSERKYDTEMLIKLSKR